MPSETENPWVMQFEVDRPHGLPWLSPPVYYADMESAVAGWHQAFDEFSRKFPGATVTLATLHDTRIADLIFG